MTISQQKYTEELGEKYGVEWGNGIPIPTTWRLSDFDFHEPNVLFPFRELIGALLWIAFFDQAGYRECSEGSSKVLQCAEADPLESGA